MLRSAVPEFKPQRGVTFLQMAIPQSYAKSTHKVSQRNTGKPVPAERHYGRK